jgi:hypothetical protein
VTTLEAFGEPNPLMPEETTEEVYILYRGVHSKKVRKMIRVDVAVGRTIESLDSLISEIRGGYPGRYLPPEKRGVFR